MTLVSSFGHESDPGKDLPALALRHVSKSFPGTLALDDVGLTVARGEVRALLGGNGSGKSTLIKILSGYHRPDPGSEIQIGGERLSEGNPAASYRLGARFVHQDLGLVDDISVLDNLSLTCGFATRFGTIRPAAARRRVLGMLDHVGLDLNPNAPVRDLSSAEKTGVALARALYGAEDGEISLLVLDEPTATLPGAEVDFVLNMVRGVASRNIAVLYVTHRLDEIFQLEANVSVLRNGREVITAPSEGMTRAELVHHLVGTELEDTRREADQAPGPDAETVLRVDNLRSRGLSGVSLEVRRGEILGVSGVTGSGRESLNAAIFGTEPRESGDVIVAGRTLAAGRPISAIENGMAFMPADRKIHGGLMDLSARENVTVTDPREFWKAPWLSRRREAAAVRLWFDKLRVRPEGAVEQPLVAFSGGNQQKVLFAKWLRRAPKVLLLDEPTQGVDIAAKGVIHHQLLAAAAAGCAVVVSSTDIDELVVLSHRVLVLRAGVVAEELIGADVSVPVVTRESLISESPPMLDEHGLTYGGVS